MFIKKITLHYQLFVVDFRNHRHHSHDAHKFTIFRIVFSIQPLMPNQPLLDRRGSNLCMRQCFDGKSGEDFEVF